ncbi:MAG: bis(5'-nucleosyl)-tetraphosphatase (symmetrical) YqeK [Clostridia bacterium]|nr:bis(5'-nucleosyl)-tetraphosphatase (symmetrical) YqeK [Clostridia bacterium]
MYSVYIDYLKENLNKHRFKHSLNVADICLYLAQKFDCDKDKAYFCGLIHDICKNESRENMLQMFDKFGIILDNVQTQVDLLWHSIAGALLVKEKFGVCDEDVLDAIKFHTTGRANMSKLEKIVFLADIISIDRNFDGVETLREISEKDLDLAVFNALKSTINNLTYKNSPIHKDTIDAYNDLAMIVFERK